MATNWLQRIKDLLGIPAGASVSADILTKPTLTQIEASAILAKEASITALDGVVDAGFVAGAKSAEITALDGVVDAGFVAGAKEASITALDAVVDAGFVAGAKDATVAKEATVSAGFTAGAKDATVAKEATSTAIKAKTDLTALDATVAKTTELISAGVIDFNATAKASIQTADAAALAAVAYTRQAGVCQIKEVAITSAANAGDVLVATVTTQPCLIESVVIHANAAQTANMTSCGVFGGAGKVITFVSAANAILANLDATDKQVAWAGPVRLAATKTIVISLVGTGAAAVNLTIVIAYRASISGGYLA